MSLEVHVRVIEAKEQPKMDFIGSVDPYVVLRVDSDAHEFQTASRWSTSDPVWNLNFRLTVHNRETDNIQILLKDFDEMTRDDPSSALQIPVK
jgi:Ca2+-dependent lipid-binding protein